MKGTGFWSEVHGLGFRVRFQGLLLGFGSKVLALGLQVRNEQPEALNPIKHRKTEART